MDKLSMDMLLTQIWQIWQMVSPYVGGVWVELQRSFAENLTPLLIGIVVGLLLARMTRGVLIVVGLTAVVFFAVRLFGIAVPSFGMLAENMEDRNPYTDTAWGRSLSG